MGWHILKFVKDSNNPGEGNQSKGYYSKEHEENQHEHRVLDFHHKIIQTNQARVVVSEEKGQWDEWNLK